MNSHVRNSSGLVNSQHREINIYHLGTYIMCKVLMTASGDVVIEVK